MVFAHHVTVILVLIVWGALKIRFGFPTSSRRPLISRVGVCAWGTITNSLWLARACSCVPPCRCRPLETIILAPASLIAPIIPLPILISIAAGQTVQPLLLSRGLCSSKIGSIGAACPTVRLRRPSPIRTRYIAPAMQYVPISAIQ